MYDDEAFGRVLNERDQCRRELGETKRVLADNTAAMLDAEGRVRDLAEVALKLGQLLVRSEDEVARLRGRAVVETTEHAEKACCQVALFSGPISLGEREG